MIGLALLVMGGYLHWFPPEGIDNTEGLEAAGLRVGLVMVALWLAYPELVKLPTWISVATFVATPIIAWRPRAALIVLPVLLVTWILYPRSKKRVDGESKSPPS